MPSSKFIVSSKVGSSFRVEKIKGMFDCDMTEVKKTFDVSIPTESMKWNIGLIVGGSGRGKTTIAKNLFPEYELFSGFEWSEPSILDDFDDKFSAKELSEILSKVGFSSPPDWLKPFRVLSNGQKMRVELARLILESDKPFIYDEFTSVVDRNVAKIGSAAIQRFVRKSDKKFIAVSCHSDIKEWLEPDWVYDVDKMEFSDSRGLLRRPEIIVNVRRAEQSEWRQFMDFHYMTHSHNNSAHKYIAEINGRAVAWCSVLHLPQKTKNFKRIHRIVVLPDYQGVGLGNVFLSNIAKKYTQDGFRVRLVTSSPSLIFSLKQHNWVMVRKPSRMKNTQNHNSMGNSSSSNRLTASFEYSG